MAQIGAIETVSFSRGTSLSHVRVRHSARKACPASRLSEQRPDCDAIAHRDFQNQACVHRKRLMKIASLTEAELCCREFEHAISSRFPANVIFSTAVTNSALISWRKSP